MKKISDLRIGQIDAQFYLNNPNDPLTSFFKTSFYESTHLNKLIDPKTFFYVGEKGTGKTAYIVYTNLFLQETHKSKIVIFDPNNFSRFVEIAEALKITKTQYPSLWSFIFAILLCQSAIEHFGAGENDELKSLFDSISDITMGNRISNIQDIIEVAMRIDDLFLAFVKLTKITKESNARQAQTYFKLERLTQTCLSYLSQLDSSKQFSLFVDSLDVRPKDLDFSAYLDVTSAVATSIFVINNTQLSKMNASIKIVLILRPDIFEIIPFQNKNTVLNMHTHLIEWTTHYRVYRTSELFKFTDKLISSQQSENSDVGASWDSYFPFVIKSRREGVEDDNPFIVFLRHSFYKPRDIIQYLHLMQAEYITHDRGSRQCFDIDVFESRGLSPESKEISKEIRTHYSRYLLQEIQDQTSFYYSLEEWQQFKDFNDGFLNQKIDRGKHTFDYNAFVEAHENFINYNRKNERITPASFKTADTLLQFMFDLNVIGYYSERVFKDGNKRVFTNYSFRQRSSANLKPKVPVGGSYVMHYGVARALFTDMQ